MGGKNNRMETFTTRNGQWLTVRPLTEDDAPLLVDLFRRLSPNSRYQRFHIPMEHVSDETIWQGASDMAHVDQINQVALIALLASDEGEQVAIAVARAHRQPGGTEAEAAIVVRDDFQSQGVGRQMLGYLVNAAVAVGITTFKGYIQADNHQMLHLLQTIGLQYTQHIEHAEAYVLIQLHEVPAKGSAGAVPPRR